MEMQVSEKRLSVPRLVLFFVLNEKQIPRQEVPYLFGKRFLDTIVPLLLSPRRLFVLGAVRFPCFLSHA